MPRPQNDPPPPDMAALLAFNPDIASQALVQLYRDGHRSLALEWAPRLDIFKSCVMRKEEPKVEPHSTLSVLYSLHYSGYASLFNELLDKRDASFIEELISAPTARDAIFTKMIDYVALSCAKNIAEHPDFSTFLFERMNPAPPEDKSYRNTSNSGLSTLADAACKNKKYDWLARINAMRMTHENQPISGVELAQRCFMQPLDPHGVKTLMDIDSISANRLRDLAQKFALSDDTAHHVFSLEILEKDFQRQVVQTEVPQGHERFSQTYSNSALFSIAHSTPTHWLEFYLQKGLDPFAPTTDGTQTLAARLFGENWRVDVRQQRMPDGSWSSNAAHVKAVRQDRLLELLKTMLKYPSDHLELRYDVATLGSEMKSSFSGARKVDLLSVFIAQGFYQCADAILAKNVDWKFAAKQCDQWMKSRSTHDGSESIAMAKAYLEGLSLRNISKKSTMRRDAKIAKEIGHEPLTLISTPRRL